MHLCIDQSIGGGVPVASADIYLQLALAAAPAVTVLFQLLEYVSHMIGGVNLILSGN